MINDLTIYHSIKGPEMESPLPINHHLEPNMEKQGESAQPVLPTPNSLSQSRRIKWLMILKAAERSNTARIDVAWFAKILYAKITSSVYFQKFYFDPLTLSDFL